MATVENITSSPIPASYIIDAELVKASDKTKKKLINNSDESFTYNLTAREISFKLEEPLYITDLEIIADEKLNKIKLKTENITSGKNISVEGEQGQAENIRIFHINKFIKSAKLRANYFTEVKIKKLTFIGFTLRDLNDIENKFDSLKEIIDSANLSIENTNKNVQNQIAELVTERAEFNDYKDSLAEQVKADEELKKSLTEENIALDNKKTGLNENISSYNSEVELLRGELNDKSNQLLGVEDKIGIKKSELKILNTGILQREAKKKELDSDISLFTDEIKSYVDECRANINLYSLLCFIPWVLIVVVTYKLFNGATELVIDLNKMENIDVWAVLITRIPFVIISSLIIITSFMVSEIFFKRIMEIHKDRLKLSKLAIIAKDVSDAEVHGLDVDDQDIYQSRIALKMQLLRSHLANEIDRDFQFNIVDKSGVLKRIAAAFGVKASDEEKSGNGES